MNIKKMLLLSFLTLSAATGVAQEVAVPSNTMAVTGTLGSDEVQFIAANEFVTETKRQTSWQDRYNFDSMMNTTLVSAIPGAFIGAITGTSISYMAGQFFDAAIIHMLNTIATRFYGSKMDAPTASLARVAAQVGSKWYWEKPLRNKLINWLIADLKAKGVEFNEEFTKTFARVAAWLGTASQVQPA